MSSDLALNLTNEMLWTAIYIGAPAIGLSLLVSLLISVLQVATQIQEMSLTFVPKILTVAFALIAFGGWMLQRLLHFAVHVISNIPSYF